MRNVVWATLVVMVSMLGLVASAVPVAASPADPVTVDELRSSVAYRADHPDVLRLYRAFFNREPDIAGALYWVQAYEDGATLDDIAWGFSNSIEFQDGYGSALDDRAFLTIVYSNVLGREPDAAGFDYWLGTMADGLGQAGVVRWIAANTEFINRYPYMDMSAALGTALLRLEDMPPNWTQDIDMERFMDDGSCRRNFIFPDNAVFAYFYSPTGVPSHIQGLYSHVTVERAEDHMQILRDRAEECTTWVDDFGNSGSIELLVLPELGDASFAVLVQYYFPFQEEALVSQIAYVRYGSNINGVIRSEFDGESPADTIQLASDSTQRLIDLAGP